MLAALLASLVLSASAQALTVDRPPARYDRPHPNLMVLETQPSKVREMCGRLFGRRNFERSGKLYACASIGDGRSPCIVVLPRAGEGIPKREIGALLRHERAHCNGWQAHHP
jgi:hypothetical protein